MSEGWDDLTETTLGVDPDTRDPRYAGHGALTKGRLAGKKWAGNPKKGGLTAAMRRGVGPGPTPPRRIGGD